MDIQYIPQLYPLQRKPKNLVKAGA
ncbi:hypothetical protein PR048_023702 [Dryococelus australis]|uniref:Uncharacterized protein n=1 Tax=Dryococelus australis TaxID=614101 RepID=A0ABQ9GUU8_9NEOP|nr:hypothetical protein PR048_023702 [Dryococelus australis]